METEKGIRLQAQSRKYAGYICLFEVQNDLLSLKRKKSFILPNEAYFYSRKIWSQSETLEMKI